MGACLAILHVRRVTWLSNRQRFRRLPTGIIKIGSVCCKLGYTRQVKASGSERAFGGQEVPTHGEIFGFKDTFLSRLHPPVMRLLEGGFTRSADDCTALTAKAPLCTFTHICIFLLDFPRF